MIFFLPYLLLLRISYFCSFQILYDFKLLFEQINDKALELKWDTLHNKPLSEFENLIDIKKISTTDIKLWQLITTFNSLKPRGDVWKLLSSLIIISEVRPRSQFENMHVYIHNDVYLYRIHL